jgi:hypothetical protein
VDLDPDKNPGPLIRKSLRKDCTRILVLNPNQTLKLNLEIRLSKLGHHILQYNSFLPRYLVPQNISITPFLALDHIFSHLYIILTSLLYIIGIFLLSVFKSQNIRWKTFSFFYLSSLESSRSFFWIPTFLQFPIVFSTASFWFFYSSQFFFGSFFSIPVFSTASLCLFLQPLFTRFYSLSLSDSTASLYLFLHTLF